MKPAASAILFLFGISLNVYDAAGQSELLDTTAIKGYAAFIDSANKGYHIAEGYTINPWTHKKSGGFSRQTYAGSNNDSVYKIEYHDNRDKNTYRIYYFKSNKIVLARVRLEEDGQGKILYESQYFYSANRLIAQGILFRNRKFAKRIRELEKVDNLRAAPEMLQEYFDVMKEDKAVWEEISQGN